MGLTDSSIIQISTLALNGLAERHKAIVSNISNAETLDYKRMDVTFEDQLEKIIQTEDTKEAIKSANSMDNKTKTPLTVNYNSQNFMQIEDFAPQSIESDQNQPNEKGNTVNIESEMSSLAKNGMTYNAIALLQSKAFKGMEEIIRGTQ